MEPAALIRAMRPANADGPREVVHEMSASMVKALHNIKLLSGMSPDWDQADIDGAEMVLMATLAPLQRRSPDALDERSTAIATLYFWLHKLPHLSGSVAPDAARPLSAHLSRCVSWVGRVAPELLEADVHWLFQKRMPEPEDSAESAEFAESGLPAVIEGKSVAQLLARYNVLLDPAVPEPAVAAVLDLQLGAMDCIDIARSSRCPALVVHAMNLGPEAAARVHSRFDSVCALATLARCAASPAVAGPSLKHPPHGAHLRDEVTQSRANDAAAYRQLLAGMATAGYRSSEPQRGWGSHMQPVTSTQPGAADAGSALSAYAKQLWELASAGADISGFEATVRDIGTIIGYGESQAESRLLAADFAGSLAVHMFEHSHSKWPKKLGWPTPNPQTNKYVAAFIARVDGKSSLDRLLEYLAEHRVDPTAPLFHLTAANMLARSGVKTLDNMLQRLTPAGVSEGYAAMYRARVMAESIVASIDAGQAHESAGATDAQVPARRRGIGA